MASEILYKMSSIAPRDSMDSVQESKALGNKRAFNLLFEAMNHYNNMSRFRKERERTKRYVYGNQWGDIIYDPDDKTYKTEEQYIRDQGNEPLANNLMRRLVRAVIGTYRSQNKEPICVARDRDEQKLGETMTTVLQYNMQLNKMSEMNARTFEDYLIGGFVVHRKWFGWRNGRYDNWTDIVDVNKVFLDSNVRDVRGWDVSFIGEIHDIDLYQLLGRFAHSQYDYQRLTEIYSTAKCYNRDYVSGFCNEFGYNKPENIDFLIPSDLSRCRVIEIWKKESKPRYRCRDFQTGDIFKVDVEDYDELVVNVNKRRLEQGKQQGLSVEEIPLIQSDWFIDNYWYYYYLSPFGDILEEGETPYKHKSHPYVFKAYPFIDGEIHGFAGDIIDQQRYTNRLISMYDMIMRSSAKGVLVVPEECISDRMDLREIAEEWHRANGVIVIKTKDNPSGVLPQQIASNATNIGIYELLNLQLKFFEDISGVNGALQGKPGYSTTSGAKYAQETQNANTSLLDILESFSSFVVDGAYKDVSNIKQYYDTKRVFNIAGKSAKMTEYDPDKMRDVEFDLSIVESTATPAYRTISNEFLMTIWQSGQITLEQMLQHIDLPFADELLQSIKSQGEDIRNGKLPQGISPEIMNQVQQKANPQSVAMLEQALRS